MTHRPLSSFQDLTKRRPVKPHTIDDISYSKDFIVCTCSWRGRVDEFLPHRRELGLTTRKRA